MGLGKQMSFSWQLLKWIYSILEKSSSYVFTYQFHFIIISLDNEQRHECKLYSWDKEYIFK